MLLRADAAESFLPHKIMVVPFAAYALDEAGFVTKHHSCRTTIILHDGKWSDQPFDKLVMDDIVGIGSDPELDDMLCIQIGSTVAVLLSGTKDKLNLIGSDKAKSIVGSLLLGSDIEIVARKNVAMWGWYEPSSPAVRLARQKDGNYGNVSEQSSLLFLSLCTQTSLMFLIVRVAIRGHETVSSVHYQVFICVSERVCQRICIGNGKRECPTPSRSRQSGL